MEIINSIRHDKKGRNPGIQAQVMRPSQTRNLFNIMDFVLVRKYYQIFSCLSICGEHFFDESCLSMI